MNLLLYVVFSFFLFLVYKKRYKKYNFLTFVPIINFYLLFKCVLGKDKAFISYFYLFFSMYIYDKNSNSITFIFGKFGYYLNTIMPIIIVMFLLLGFIKKEKQIDLSDAITIDVNEKKDQN